MTSQHLLRGWRLLACSLLLATGATIPRGHAETTTSQLMITVNVINSCSFDSSTTAPLSITCSMQTPVAASSSGVPAGVGATGASSTPANTVSPLHVTSKFCNFLATEQLENASFNQFSLDMAGHTAGPESYYSTMQVCF